MIRGNGMLRDRVLEHLAALIASDTQNPPREIDGDNPFIGHCRRSLGSDFQVEVRDYGEGRVSFYAVRGKPRILFNVHLDTVPVGLGWSTDPLRMQVDEEKAIGRGACDIKGAAACLLAIAEQAPDNMALLFTTDEEGVGACCVREFCEFGEHRQYRQAVVAEPTGCESVLGHRGILSVESRFHGTPGHSSEARALRDSAIHQMSRWAAGALEVAAEKVTPQNPPGSCLNLGHVEGGTASNVIAGEAAMKWSARLRPGSSNRAFLEQLRACVPADAQVDWDVQFAGEPLPATDRNDEEARGFAARHGLPVAGDVDFWTEAAIFSEFGLPALVLGPGRIEQAHIADEWVALAQLDRACELYGDIIESDR